jgi:hypothetical protein
MAGFVKGFGCRPVIDLCRHGEKPASESPRRKNPRGQTSGFAGYCWTFDARDRMPRSSRPTAHHLAENAPTMTQPLPRERVRSTAPNSRRDCTCVCGLCAGRLASGRSYRGGYVGNRGAPMDLAALDTSQNGMSSSRSLTGVRARAGAADAGVVGSSPKPPPA